MTYYNVISELKRSMSGKLFTLNFELQVIQASLSHISGNKTSHERVSLSFRD